MRRQVEIRQNGRHTNWQHLPIRQSAGQWLAQYHGVWLLANMGHDFCLVLDIVRPAKVRPAPTMPPVAPTRPQGQPIAAAPATATYEAWKAGKIGHGPVVTAPRGKGREWADRLYCERAVERAKVWQGSNYTGRQLRTGSYQHRVWSQQHAARSEAWRAGLEPAEAIMAAPVPDGCDPAGIWAGRKELIRECLDYSSFLLSMAGN